MRKKKLQFTIIITILVLFSFINLQFNYLYQNYTISDKIPFYASTEDKNNTFLEVTIIYPSENYCNSSIASINEPIIYSRFIFDVDYNYSFTVTEINDTYDSIMTQIFKEDNTFPEKWSDTWRKQNIDEKNISLKIPLVCLIKDRTIAYFPRIYANISKSIYKALDDAWFIGAIDPDPGNVTLHLCDDNDNVKIFSYPLIFLLGIASITVLFIIKKRKKDKICLYAYKETFIQ